MFKLLNITSYLFLFCLTFQTNAKDNFKIFYPELILNGSDFEVSIITSKRFLYADKLNLYLYSESLNIKSVQIWTANSKTVIPLQREFLHNFSKSFQKCSIRLNDTTLFSQDSYFQIIIKLSGEGKSSNTLNIYGEFLDGEKIVGHLENSDEKIISDQPNLYEIKTSSYERYFTAGYSAEFKEGSYLNIPLVYDFDEMLLAEFWMKIQDYTATFLEIINWETNRIEYLFSLNDNQMLIVNSNDDISLSLNPFFISKNSYYHVSLILNKPMSLISVLIDGEKLAEIKIDNYLAYDNLVLHFENKDQSGTFYLDQFRLIKSFRSNPEINRNKNYNVYSDDSSSVILQMNFSESELEDFSNNKLLSYEKIKLTMSDAPIFPRTPEFEVKLYNNYYEIIWEGGDIENASYYIVEKAIGSYGFMQIGKQEANTQDKKVYSVICEKLNQPEIVYFRLKQVNKDGSQVYTDVVKVGQGVVEDLEVRQNYPNPFNPITFIKFELLQDSEVEVKVFNLAGKEVALLHKGFLARGEYHMKFDASELSSGIYLYQINTSYSSQTRKMILAK